MGFERPANCPMGDSQNTGPNMWGMRGGPRGPMMGRYRTGNGPGCLPYIGPEQGWLRGWPDDGSGTNFTPGPRRPVKGGMQ
jgi:hypothetical protein